MRTLLTAGGVQDPDALADIALGPLAPELYHHQLKTLGIPHERITQALVLSARRLLSPTPP